MDTFNNIAVWITDNKDSFIVESIMLCVVFAVSRLWTLRKNLPNTINRLRNIKGIKYLGFILLYALPLGTIGAMIIDQTKETTFKNIALFIVICTTFIFNVLMSHVISIYKMISELTNKVSQSNSVHKKSINLIFEKTGLKERLK